MYSSASTPLCIHGKRFKGIARLLVFTFIFSLSLPAVADAATKGAGFIALSEDRMSWPDAKAWCEQQGGKLPLINGATSLTRRQIADSGTVLIDGFGQINTRGWNTPWPSSLSSGFYWTGTEDTDSPGLSWFVGGVVRVNLGGTYQNNDRRVACVP